MAISTYTIEVRVEFEDEDKYDHMLELARQSARDLYTAAMMLKDKRDPKLTLMTGDMFQSEKDLSIMSPEELGNGE